VRSNLATRSQRTQGTPGPAASVTWARSSDCARRQAAPGDLPAFLAPARHELLLAGLQQRALRRLAAAEPAAPAAAAAAQALVDGWAAAAADEAGAAGAAAARRGVRAGARTAPARAAGVGEGRRYGVRHVGTADMVCTSMCGVEPAAHLSMSWNKLAEPAPRW